MKSKLPNSKNDISKDRHWSNYQICTSTQKATAALGFSFLEFPQSRNNWWCWSSTTKDKTYSVQFTWSNMAIGRPFPCWAQCWHLDSKNRKNRLLNEILEIKVYTQHRITSVEIFSRITFKNFIGIIYFPIWTKGVSDIDGLHVEAEH